MYNFCEARARIAPSLKDEALRRRLFCKIGAGVTPYIESMICFEYGSANFN